MKAISLWQPWATLVVLGVKTYETRSWHPNGYRGPIAIHAAKRWTKEEAHFLGQLQSTFPAIKGLLEKHNITTPPLGCIVGTALITDCMSTTSALRQGISEIEIACGDFSPNRWAWRLEQAEMFSEPFPCKGHQGLFYWNRSTAELIRKLKENTL